MRRCALFLNGNYRRQYLEYYTKITRGCDRIAVDGGLRYFLKRGALPRLLIGDLDSLSNAEIRKVPSARIVRFPVEKDKTDSQIALEHCLAKGAEEVLMVMPTLGELDHLLANFMLVISAKVAKDKNLRLSIHNHAFRADWLRNRTLQINKAVGDRLSILPMSSSRLECVGTKYGAADLRVRPGDTVALRNWITSPRSSVKISGAAWVIRYYSTS